MLWYFGTLGAYIVVFRALMAANDEKLTPIGASLAAVGFLVANFIGIGLAVRKPGESFRKGVTDGMRFGRSWLGYMAIVAGAAAVLFLLQELGARW